jgi:hypothetical protein
MKLINLQKVEHEIKVGKKCEYIEPNITEDSLFYLEGKLVGFYISSVEGKFKSYLEIANKEFRSNNVPKSLLERSDVFKAVYTDGLTRKEAKRTQTVQMSTILGSIPPKPHMRRPYPSISAVHAVESAQTYIKAMLLTCKEAELIVKEIMPKQYKTQLDVFKSVKDKWKFGKLFTSSISNFNISAPYHRDTGNFKDTINVILTKRKDSKGGCLNVPDYGITIEQADNSMLVYPAWLNVHGVTPIIPTKEGGYRNSLIFYPLKAFKGLD